MIVQDSLKQAIKRFKKAPDKFPEKWKLNLDKEKEIEWICGYCGQSLGVGGSEGAKLGKCPHCGSEQVGSGITIISKETKKYLKKLEKRLKNQTKIGPNRS